MQLAIGFLLLTGLTTAFTEALNQGRPSQSGKGNAPADSARYFYDQAASFGALEPNLGKASAGFGSPATFPGYASSAYGTQSSAPLAGYGVAGSGYLMAGSAVFDSTNTGYGITGVGGYGGLPAYAGSGAFGGAPAGYVSGSYGAAPAFYGSSNNDGVAATSNVYGTAHFGLGTHAAKFSRQNGQSGQAASSAGFSGQNGPVWHAAGQQKTTAPAGVFGPNSSSAYGAGQHGYNTYASSGVPGKSPAPVLPMNGVLSNPYDYKPSSGQFPQNFFASGRGYNVPPPAPVLGKFEAAKGAKPAVKLPQPQASQVPPAGAKEQKTGQVLANKPFFGSRLASSSAKAQAHPSKGLKSRKRSGKPNVSLRIKQKPSKKN